MSPLRPLLLVPLVIAAALASAMLTSCNTVRGAGRDVENVGSAVSHLGR